jgi:hypothetical protein
VKYRLAQTWSLTRKAPLVVAGTNAPAAGWDTFRTSFINDASMKFGRAAAGTDDPLAQDALTRMLTAAASAATATVGPTFFIEEGFPIIPAPGQTAAAAASSVAPESNGDPVTSPAAHVSQIDDTTVVTTVGPADAYPTPLGIYAITVVVLGQIIDKEVMIAQGTDYTCVTSSKARAPSPGPKATASAGGDVGVDPFQAAINQLLANGVAQSEIDNFFANIPTGDATEDMDSDLSDAESVDDGDLDSPPARRETA